jgi:hypothetical protein
MNTPTKDQYEVVKISVLGNIAEDTILPQRPVLILPFRPYVVNRGCPTMDSMDVPSFLLEVLILLFKFSHEQDLVLWHRHYLFHRDHSTFSIQHTAYNRLVCCRGFIHIADVCTIPSIPTEGTQLVRYCLRSLSTAQRKTTIPFVLYHANVISE